MVIAVLAIQKVKMNTGEAILTLKITAARAKIRVAREEALRTSTASSRRLDRRLEL
ncbi:MAG: hypothetical protein ABIG67_07495 [Pseudomonadota bacterium]